MTDRSFILSIVALLAALPTTADPNPVIQKYCVECHDAQTQKGNLDLTALTLEPADPKSFAQWVNIHDRVTSGEMPPKKKPRPDAAELAAFVAPLAQQLTAADTARAAAEGRAVQRRLNRYEYENALRDLLHAPWLQVRDALPEDGESHRFNKSGGALDVSHVQMARYLSVADYALRQVVATQVDRPDATTTRYYTRDQRSFTGKMTFSVFNQRAERATFPVLGYDPQPDVRSGKAPITDPKLREQEAVAVVASTYEPLEITFNKFRAPAAGRYKLRFKSYTVWTGPGKPANKWYIPDLDAVSKGRRDEPITIYSETPPRLLRRLGAFDAKVDPAVAELDVELLAGETIRPDAARLFRSRPPNWINPLAEQDGSPGVAFAWLEVEGPIYDQWPAAGHKLLFGDLPIKPGATGPGVDVISGDSKADAKRLMRAFLTAAYRGPVADSEVDRFLAVVDAATKSGASFADAMIAGYTAALCSPRFVCLAEPPGPLGDHALAARLSFFLTNGPPDDELRRLATANRLRKPEVLRAQTDRLLSSADSRRFVDAFLDYWLDLRKINATAADGTLYNDYYLDDLLVESALEETQLFFAELLEANLPARNLVASDFAMLNERLATHYGIPGIDGVAIHRVQLPPTSVRGGLMTQASVLKVTANGTTTSPVVRGAWIMDRLLGKPPSPPPPSVPAVEPDTRGATTIRQQLDQHRTLESCNACHAKIDPPGFALENFDVMGGWRDRYRALGDGTPEKGLGKNGQKFIFHPGPPVDPTGQLPGAGAFADIREFKALLLNDQRQLARNLVRQLLVYSTGTPPRFGDRPAVEAILDRTAKSDFAVRNLVHEIVQSDLFLNK